MFEQFSNGYYLGRMYVEPHDGDTAVMCRTQHDQVTEQLYERPDLPPVMKLRRTHFPVSGEDGVPADTLVLPEALLADADIDNPPALREVFLAKADRAAQLLKLAESPAI